MRTLPRQIVLGALPIAAALAALAAALHAREVPAASQASTPAGVTRESNGAPPEEGSAAALFKTYCATCHEGPAANPQAPSLEVLRLMSAEQVLAALEKGTMRPRVAERSRSQRRELAAYASGKPLAADSDVSIPTSAFCGASAPPPPPRLTGPGWNGWGHGINNARYQPAAAAGLTAEDVPRLTLKWAFGFPGATSAGTQPVVAGGRVYVGTAEGDLYVLDAKTGCIHWTREVDASIRSAITLEERGDGRLVAYFGDQAANVYAVDASNGTILWKVEVDEHPHAAITAAPQLYNGRLYVPVSSREESQVGDPRYPCCSFRGSVVALEAASGRRLWKTYSVAQPAGPTAKNSIGTQLFGPAGGAIWNTPTIDAKRNVLYVGTGNNFAPPSTDLSDSLLALDLESGAIRWSYQVTSNDIWNGSCRLPTREAAACPDKDAPDFDFTSSSQLVEAGEGRQLVVVGNKSGVVFGFDPDARGEIVWQRRIARGAASGGVFWGTATDGVNLYAASADFVADDPAASGGLYALDLRTGRLVWSLRGAGCAGRAPCKPSQAAAVTLIDGAVFSGTMDGRLRAHSARDGELLWEYDTAREFATVNGVKANGGSMSNSGPAIVGGMLYVNSGYSHHGGILPGNVLLAFSAQ